VPSYEYTPLASGEIEVEALVTPEELATLDRAEDVERLDKLLAKVQDEIDMGLAAMARNLRDKFGDPSVRIHTRSES
jgi:hypothetical protein